MTTDVIILAAGQGTRMNSVTPKVLHTIAGRPMLGWVLQTAQQLTDKKINVVVGHQSDKIKTFFAAEPINWVEQKEQLGTGHAVLQALPNLTETTTLILYGDVPLIKQATLKRLVEKTNSKTLALLTINTETPDGYGRIVRQDGVIQAIVEHKDATEQQRQINEINTGILAVPTEFLATYLPQVENNNAQKEFYLTDLIALACKNNFMVVGELAESLAEVQGVNNRSQQAQLEREVQKTQAEELMAQGASIFDPQRLDIRGNVSIGRDVIIDINVVFEGEVTLGDNVYIGANSYIKDTSICSNVTVKPSCVIDGAIINSGCTVGPFAHLRPETILNEKARVGNFVEIKKSTIGDNSKVNHLSYIGDAIVGENVNIGAGTITCNYDGMNKSKTVIESGAFIGSNSALVAPVTIGKNATIGAGSTITRNVNDSELSVARGKQKNITGWQRPEKKKRE